MALKSAWTTAPLGRMAPIEQAKLWAIRAVLVDQGEAADQYQRMSRFVVKVGGAAQGPGATQVYHGHVYLLWQLIS